MKISDKREAGEMLGRDGISERIILIAESISKGSLKNAIIQAGRISELVDASSYDDYWRSKANSGASHEKALMTDLITGFTSKENMTAKDQKLERES